MTSSIRLRNSGRKVRSQLLHHLRLHGLVGVLLRLGRAKPMVVSRWICVGPHVGGHDEHRVAEVHGAALGVGQPPVLQHLQEDVEHFGVRLLDLIEKDHRVRPAPHPLRELPAFLVAHVAGRRADEPGHGMSLHVLRHVQRIMASSSPNSASARARASSDLPTPVGSQEDEGADGALRILQPGPGPAHRPGHRLDGLVLADDPLVEISSRLSSRSRLLLGQLRHRDARPAGHDLGDVLFVHRAFRPAPVVLPLRALAAPALLQLLLLVPQAAAFSNSSFLMADSFSMRVSSMRASSSFSSGGATRDCRRTLEAASSIRSMALSGRYRSVTYRSDSRAAARMASSVIFTRWWAS